MVCVGLKGGVWVRGLVVCLLCLLCLLYLPRLLLFRFVLLVFGVVRAQPCEHARYPRTPLCSFFLLFVLLLFVPAFSLPSAFLFVGMAVCDSPCVRVFGGHDSNRESVSFVFVFLVVACSAFAVFAVAASAVAFGAQHSAVVWMVSSA